MNFRRIVLFNKQLNVASDDFVFTCSLEAISRICGLVIVLFEFVRYLQDMDTCSTGHLIHTYLSGLMLFILVTIVQDVLIVRVSMKGTIVNDAGRKNITTFLYIRIFTLVLETAWTALGTASILIQLPEWASQPRIYWLSCLAVMASWLNTVIQVIFIFVAFDFKRRDHKAVFEAHDWEKWLKNIFCCLKVEGSRHVFSTLSKLCAQLFTKEELVGSDILTGLILVYNKQVASRRQLDVHDASLLSGRLRSKPHKIAASPSVPRQSWMNMAEAAHYMKFSLASYGWFYYVGLDNPILASCRLLPKLNWGVRPVPRKVEQDGRLLANTAAFLLTTGLHMNDIVVASYHNEIYAIPFYVSIDKESKSIVVSIRGTLSIEDLLTDLVVERAPVKFEGVKGHVHLGMYQSAKYIKHRLVIDGLLETAFSRAPDYRLVITGHSLGGGVAALLALELRPLYRNIICFAFASPGELISGNLVSYSEEFICTVALGYDVVPRLGLLEIMQLRIDILLALRDCNLPKHQVIAQGFWTKLFGKAKGNISNMYVSNQQTECFNNYISKEMAQRQQLLCDYEPLLLPGQILHILEKHDPNRSWSVIPDYYAQWTDSNEFREIVLSKRMIAHHFPDALLRALRQLADHVAMSSNTEDFLLPPSVVPSDTTAATFKKD